MITLHKKREHASSDQLQKKLEELVIAFKKEVHPDDAAGLPYIVEDEKEYQSKEAIEEWLAELSEDLNWQRSLSGDGCYIDPKKGKVC